MKIQVQAPFSVSEPLNDLIEERIEKVTSIFDRFTSVKVFMKDEIQRHHHKENRHVEIQMEAPGQTFFAEAHAETFEKAITTAADKVKRQVRKYKTQITDHH
jgi:putative sigma-54 modulation protein